MPERITGFRGEFLWEWEIAERQLLQLANAFNATDYEWRPDTNARGVSEVLVHVACGTFMLLELFGTTAPADLYLELPEPPMERLWAFVRKNDDLERRLREKDKVVSLLSRALASAREAITHTDDADLERSLLFFGERITVRRVCLRLLAHTHEFFVSDMLPIHCLAVTRQVSVRLCGPANSQWACLSITIPSMATLEESTASRVLA